MLFLGISENSFSENMHDVLWLAEERLQSFDILSRLHGGKKHDFFFLFKS